MQQLKILCKPIDDLLQGGLRSGVITRIYGEGGTGKTNICLQACCCCASQDFKVAYIDSEGISIERLKQICKDPLFFQI